MKSNNFSLSPQAELFAIGGDDGKLQIHSTENGDILRVLEGHFGDINHTQFFPSGQVLLSSASDFLIKIWSVLDGTNPVTLKGHTRGVTNTQIVNRGWNIVSGSLDGTVKLWECGTGKVVRDFKLGQDSVNWISLLDNSSEIDKYTSDVVNAGASGHKLLSCNNNGSFTLLDLNNPKPVSYFNFVFLLNY
jgi:proteasomal ATPase-associated factor 1